MNSKEGGGIVAGQIAIISARVLDVAIKKGVEAGVAAAVDYMDAERKKQRKDRYNRRLHKTRLLLKNYRSLKHHALGAVSSGEKVNERIRENAVDILEGLDDEMISDKLYIDSIRRSQQRTRIIIEHIDEMLRYWEIDCQQSGKEENIRRCRIIRKSYIEDDYTPPDVLAAMEHIEKRTVYKDIGAAMRPLSALIFGIDGIRQE